MYKLPQKRCVLAVNDIPDYYYDRGGGRYVQGTKLALVAMFLCLKVTTDLTFEVFVTPRSSGEHLDFNISLLIKTGRSW